MVWHTLVPIFNPQHKIGIEKLKILDNLKFSLMRKGRLVVHSTALERRRPQGLVGSNPTPSAL